jgi:hypothetical protein
VRLSVTHWYDFGGDAGLVGSDLVGAEAWDALRTATSGPFGLPESRAAWEAAADNPVVKARACAVDATVRARGVRALASYAVGTAVGELWLTRLDPSRRIVVTEFAPLTAARLERLFPEAEVREHDLRTDVPIPDVDLHLLYRVDTELTDDLFSDLLARFARVPLVVVATELLTPRAVLRELRTRMRPRATRAGLVRSRDAFEAILQETHDARRLRIHDLQGWLLEPR